MKQGGADHGTQPGTLLGDDGTPPAVVHLLAFDFLLLFPFPLQLEKSQSKSFKISRLRYCREK